MAFDLLDQWALRAGSPPSWFRPGTRSPTTPKGLCETCSASEGSLFHGFMLAAPCPTADASCQAARVRFSEALAEWHEVNAANERERDLAWPYEFAKMMMDRRVAALTHGIQSQHEADAAFRELVKSQEERDGKTQGGEAPRHAQGGPEAVREAEEEAGCGSLFDKYPNAVIIDDYHEATITKLCSEPGCYVDEAVPHGHAK